MIALINVDFPQPFGPRMATCSPRAQAQINERRFPRDVSDLNNIPVEALIHGDGSNPFNFFHQAGGIGGREVGMNAPHRFSFQNFRFGVGIRIPEADPHHEPVQLRFGKRKGSMVFMGILGGDHEK